MKDVRLIVYGVGESFSSDTLQMNELPKEGEYISTIYFQLMYKELEQNKFFRVARVLHHYVDDMSAIDFTEIELERTLE